MKKFFAIVLIISMCSMCGCSRKIATPTGEEIKSEDSAYTNNTVKFAAATGGILNPLVSESNSLIRFMEYVYEPLFSKDQNLRPVPVLATSAATDGNSITVTLKENVLWHDGTAFCADDVVYTVNSIINSKTNISRPEFSSIKKLDNKTVIISLKKPVINAALSLTFPIVKNGTSFSGKGVPVGTGRYRYNGKISVDEYSFHPFESYHQTLATDILSLTEVDSFDTELQMFGAGETDALFYNSTEALGIANGKTNVIGETGSVMVYLGVNTNNPIFSGTNTRRAVACVINKSTIANTFMQKRAKAADYMVNPSSFVLEGKGYILDFNVDKAEEYMHTDGWKLDNGIFVRDYMGQDQEAVIRILAKENDADIAEYISSELTAFGIECSVHIADEEMYNETIRQGYYDLYLGEADLGDNMDYTKLTDAYADETLSTLTRQYAATGEGYYECLLKIKDDALFIPLVFKDNVIFSSIKFR